MADVAYRTGKLFMAVLNCSYIIEVIIVIVTGRFNWCPLGAFSSEFFGDFVYDVFRDIASELSFSRSRAS